MRLKGKPWRVELPSFGECVDYVGVRVKTTERIVNVETGHMLFNP